jgi:dihydrofolate reductase/thymidylate synthase
MDFNIILACDKKGGIGKQVSDKQSIPWKIAEDMLFFKLITTDTNSYDSKEAENKSYAKIMEHIFGSEESDESDEEHDKKINHMIDIKNDDLDLDMIMDTTDEGLELEPLELEPLEDEIKINVNDTREQKLSKLKLNREIINRNCNKRIVNAKIERERIMQKLDLKHKKRDEKRKEEERKREEERLKEEELKYNTLPFPSNKNLFNVVIMGRKTADTLSNPLSDRLNVVITSRENYREKEGFVSFSTLDDALNTLKSYSTEAKKISKVFVIGGAELCDQAILHPRCRGVFLTRIVVDYKTNIMLSDKFLSVIHDSSIFQPSWAEKAQTINPEWMKIAFTVKPHGKENTDDEIIAGWDLQFMKFTYSNDQEIKYLNMLDKILTKGDLRETRNAKTYSIFGEKLEFDLSKGFPLLTTKQVFFRGIVEELLFFLRGDTNTKVLEDKKVMIWHNNTTQEFMKNNSKDLEPYDMGPMYGFQWRHFGALYNGSAADYESKGIDQLKNVIDLLVSDPHSRRIMMTTYNPLQAEQGVLYPCHGIVTQFYVESNNRISLQMYQRSADSVLGVPFNIASYAILLHIIVELVNNNIKRTHQTDYVPGRVIMVFGDTHIYSDTEKGDHIQIVREQLKRANQTYPFCKFKLNKKLVSVEDLNTLQYSDMELSGYIAGPALKAEMVA